MDGELCRRETGAFDRSDRRYTVFLSVPRYQSPGTEFHC